MTNSDWSEAANDAEIRLGLWKRGLAGQPTIIPLDLVHARKRMLRDRGVRIILAEQSSEQKSDFSQSMPKVGGNYFASDLAASTNMGWAAGGKAAFSALQKLMLPGLPSIFSGT